MQRPKEIAILLGMQQGYTKHGCPYCLWDSRDHRMHFVRKVWPERRWIVSTENVINIPLVKPEKVLPPPLHIKLGLMRNFVRALDKAGEPFKAIEEMFPKLSKGKVEAGVFDGPQIRKVFESEHFEFLLTEVESAAWTAFKNVVVGFLGNNRVTNYKDLVDTLMLSLIHISEPTRPY